MAVPISEMAVTNTEDRRIMFGGLKLSSALFEKSCDHLANARFSEPLKRIF